MFMNMFKSAIQACRVVCLILLVVLGLLVFINVITRFMGISVPWITEVIQITTVWMVFLGTAVVLFEKEHISLDLFNEARMPRWMRYVQQLAVSISVMIVCLVFIIGGWQLLSQGGTQTSAILQLPRFYWYLSLPVCGVLMVIVVFHRLGRLMREIRE